MTSCLAGIAGSAASFAVTGYNNYDGFGLLSAFFFGVRANTVAQAFDRRFSAIDYKIQKQQLHREDIRDLIELTTARMDIYHIVGTLLLAFCMGWYTDNTVSVGALPIWFSDIFMISNFAAVGYLILCVWLAMYAAVAARSIGVRLLTSYARISFPTNYQINQIKQPMFFNSLDYFRRLHRRRTAKAEDVESLSVPNCNDNNNFPSNEEQLREEEEQPDNHQHFRRFLEVLPRFIVYDTYARVCMTYGMNQMLQALSYFILGYVWEKSMLSAIMSFMAVQILGYIVLYLDVGDMSGNFGDLMSLIFLNFLPPFLASALLFSETIYAEGYTNRGAETANRLSILATLVFFAHGGWLWYLVTLFRYAGKRTGRFKPGGFESVLEWVEVDLKRIEKTIVDKLDHACRTLASEMVLAGESELKKGAASSEYRISTCKELCEKVQGSYKAVAETFVPEDNAKTAAIHPIVQQAMQLGEYSIERYQLWVNSAELLAALEALRGYEPPAKAALQKAFSESEQKEIEEAYTSFLKQSTALNLETCRANDGTALTAKRISKQDRYLVQLGSGDNAKLISATGEQLPKDAPTSLRITSYEEVITKVFPKWLADVDGLNRMHKLHRNRFIDGGRDPVRWETGPAMAMSEKKDWVPTKMLRWFTVMTIGWWFLAGGVHAVGVIYGGTNTPLWDSVIGQETYNVSVLEIPWPTPKRLFRVSSLHCDSSHVWVSSKFAAFAVDSIDLRTLTKSSNESVVGMFCGGPRGCDAVRPAGKSWEFMRHDSLGQKTSTLPLPSSWRLVSGTWTNCLDHETSSCTSAQVAGWDGTAVVSATLKRESVIDSWTMSGEFEADPALGLCTERSFGAFADCARREHLKYDDVKAIHIGGDGRSLLVLFDNGLIDAWDLGSGIVKKRWKLGHNYSTMCYNGGRLLLTSQRTSGPELVAMPLPTSIAGLFQPKTYSVNDFHAEQRVDLQHSMTLSHKRTNRGALRPSREGTRSHMPGELRTGHDGN